MLGYSIQKELAVTMFVFLFFLFKSYTFKQHNIYNVLYTYIKVYI